MIVITTKKLYETVMIVKKSIKILRFFLTIKKHDANI